MNTTLKASTPVGEFTRTTSTAYTHVVVWNSPRAMEYFEKCAADPEMKRMASGVHSRWIKDRGYGVTWHASEAAARNVRRYSWDGNDATLVGVFAVNV